MKRRSLEKAYRDLRPDEAARERMLQNILSSASEIPLTGKDEMKMRRKRKPAVIAALVALMVLLMGCAIVVLNLQDMKLGDWVSPGDSYVDEQGNTVTEPDIVREIVSLQGLAGSPGMLAAQEWFEFEQSYDPDYTLINQAEERGFRAPEDYDAYSVYTQEMIDKIDQIAAKYNLKLAGPTAIIQRDNNELFFEALGLERVHHDNTWAEVEYGSGYFYGCGNFDLSFHVQLTGENTTWPYEILGSMRYNDKEYLDVVGTSITDIDQMEQYTYRTADGTDVLIVLGDEKARVFCDRDDAFVYVSFFTYHENENGEKEYMTNWDVERVVDYTDFGVKPKQPDMEYVKQKLAEYEAKRQEELASRPEETDEQIYRAHIQNRLDNLEHPENVYYLKWDVNGDGTMDLLMGSKEKLEVIFTVMDDENSGTRHITFLPLAQEEYAKWEEFWPEMEIWPITTYPLPSGEQGYQRLIRDGLEAMEHPQNMYYAMLDVNEDGTLDLLLGSKDQLNVIWTYESSTQQIKFLGYGKDMEELEKAWPNMELWPITEYPLY